MRVSVLRKSLFAPCNLFNAPVPIGGLGAAGKSQWSAALLRTPHLKSPKPTQQTRVLDKGFFFPVSTPWVHGGVTHKRLSTKVGGHRTPASALCRVSSIWEVLEGGEFSLIKRGGKPEIRQTNDGYSSSHSLSFYGGVKPFKRRKRKRVQIKSTLSPNKGGISKKRAKKIAGFKKALRLLPRRKRKARSYRYLKSVRPRASLWRAARFPRLRAPLVWSKKATHLNKTTPQIGLRASLPKLSPKTPGLDKLYGPARGVCSTHIPMFRQWGAGKKKNFRVPQARYKPGLSKAWRLLRLQFCLAWGLPWLRQRRFTNYVSQLNGITGLNFLKMCVSSVGFVVRASSLTLSGSFGDKAFVNGQHVCNPFFQVFMGDRITVAGEPLPSNNRRKALTGVIDMPPVAG